MQSVYYDKISGSNLSAADICELCTVYGQNVMLESALQSVHFSKSGRTNICDEERSSRFSAVREEFITKTDEKVHENKWFTTSELSEQFCKFLTLFCMIPSQ